MATDCRLDEGETELCCIEDAGSAGAAKVDVDDDTASVAKMRDELGVILIAPTV